MLTNLPQGTPVWLIIALVIITAILTLSERLAKLSGPIGALARWFQQRQLREVERKAELDEVIDSAVERRVEREIKPWKITIKRLEDQVQRLSEKLELKEEQHRKEIEWLVNYIARVAAWWHRMKIRLAAQGVEIDEDMPVFAEYPGDVDS